MMLVRRYGVMVGLLACLTWPSVSVAEPGTHTIICNARASLSWTAITKESEAAPEAVALITRMSEMVGIEPNFEVRAADFGHGGTAFASIKNGQRYIVYDRSKFNFGNGEASYAHLGILAHEVGHHLASHVVTRETSPHARELEADRYAGFAMAHMGVGFMEAQHMFRKDWPASLSHPGSLDRREAVRDGWLAGREEVLRHRGECQSRLIGDEYEIEGRICRVVSSCNDDIPLMRIACRDVEGSWSYGNPSGSE